ncbi:MAG TPA: glycosyltransferase [Bryobacteraceae bacterium]|nr:glycosyltransferase [Bryobacteraceae bacterium]
MSAPLVSVVIIGRNEGERLERCLRSVFAMRPPGGELEVIYVDSDSRDGSPERARAMGAEVLVVRPERPTAALGRNAGWRRARGTFVLFLDGDTILDANFVADSLAEFENPRVAVVWGHRREIRPQDSFYNRVLDLDWISPAGVSDYCGGDALMRRAVLEEVGGYDETLIAGEEPEMCRRMRGRGYLILHVDRPMTGHDLAMTRWGQYWRRATRTGYAYAEVSSRFRGTDLPFWEYEARRNRSRGGMLLLCLAAGLLGSAAWRKPWPLAGVLAVYLLLAARTAVKLRWKSRDAVTLFLYGLHSHVQQIPILIGQWQYWRDRRAGRRRQLIEYKGAQP